MNLCALGILGVKGGTSNRWKLIWLLDPSEEQCVDTRCCASNPPGSWEERGHLARLNPNHHQVMGQQAARTQAPALSGSSAHSWAWGRSQGASGTEIHNTHTHTTHIHTHNGHPDTGSAPTHRPHAAFRVRRGVPGTPETRVHNHASSQRRTIGGQVRQETHPCPRPWANPTAAEGVRAGAAQDARMEPGEPGGPGLLPARRAEDKRDPQTRRPPRPGLRG